MAAKKEEKEKLKEVFDVALFKELNSRGNPFIVERGNVTDSWNSVSGTMAAWVEKNPTPITVNQRNVRQRFETMFPYYKTKFNKEQRQSGIEKIKPDEMGLVE